MSSDPEHSRHTLATKKNAFNQVRNAVYWLERYMKQENLSTPEITDRFMRMGKNMGATYSKEIITSAKDVGGLLEELYYITVKSKVTITQTGNQFTVSDPKCAMCKYQYNDIDVAGCTISMATVGEMVSRLGFTVKNMMVLKSKTHGDEVCTHQFEIIPKRSK